jgi:hypothetical protein
MKRLLIATALAVTLGVSGAAGMTAHAASAQSQGALVFTNYGCNFQVNVPSLGYSASGSGYNYDVLTSSGNYTYVCQAYVSPAPSQTIILAGITCSTDLGNFSASGTGEARITPSGQFIATCTAAGK